MRDSYNSLLMEQNKFFRSGKTLPLKFRIEKLRKLKEIIQKNEDKILKALHDDSKKPKFEAYMTELAIVYNEIDYIIKHLKSWMKSTPVPTPYYLQPGRAKIISEPYGIVAIFSPWNYPFQLAILPAVAAIAAGNCIILKTSEVAPQTQELVKNLINKNFEKGFFCALSGGVAESEILLKEKFDFILFTGSTNVGRIIMQAAAKHLTPICLELGGKNPCIIDSSAKLETAARRVVWGKFTNAGQTCVAPDYVYLHESIADEFLKYCVESIKQFFGDNPQKSADYTRIINHNHFNRLFNLIEEDYVLHGGDSDSNDNYIAPTIMRDVSWDMEIMKDEIFGPILPTMKFNDLKQVIHTINSHPKPLAAYIFSESQKNINEFISHAHYGGGCINDCMTHLGNHNLPFGGVGESGMGSYHGKFGFDLFSHKKSIQTASTFFDNPFRYPPFTEKKFGFLKKFLT